MSEVMDSWPWHVLVRVPTVSWRNGSVWVSINVNNSPKTDLRVEKWLTSLGPLCGSVWDPTGLNRNVEKSERMMKEVTLCICDLIVSQPESLLVPAGVWHKLGVKKLGHRSLISRGLEVSWHSAGAEVMEPDGEPSYISLTSQWVN